MELVKTKDSKILLLRGDGRQLTWNLKFYEKTRFKTVEGAFDEINQYWAYIPEERREAIWSIYEQIYFTLYKVADITSMAAKLIRLVTDLYELQPYEELSRWVKIHGNVRIPDGVLDMIDPNETSRSIIARTYVKTDYMDLVILAIALRPMVPIWDEYIERVKEWVGSNYKETAAMKLLYKSHIVDSEPMKRLMTYINGSIDPDTEDLSGILSGLGSAEKPEWLLSMVVVRRIATGEVLVSPETKSSLITNIYAFVVGTLRDIDRKFGGAVREKFSKDYANNEDDRTSTVELYKVKQFVSCGDVALYSVYTEDPFRMALSIDNTVPLEQVKLCVDKAMTLETMVIRTHNLVFCQWIMNPIITARAIHTLNKVALLKVMGVTQALLWHWGFHELAAIVTSDMDSEENGITLNLEMRPRIPQELQKQLADLYPYTENVGRSKGQGRGAVLAVKSIQALAKEITSGIWISTAPAELEAQIGISSGHRLTTPATHMEMLTRLVIRLAEMEQQTYLQSQT